MTTDDMTHGALPKQSQTAGWDVTCREAGCVGQRREHE